jgi:hypothetical protein
VGEVVVVGKAIVGVVNAEEEEQKSEEEEEGEAGEERPSRERLLFRGIDRDVLAADSEASQYGGGGSLYIIATSSCIAKK